MSATVTSITVSEWETVTSATCPELSGRFVDDSPCSRRIVDELNQSRLLRLTELRNGLEISAFSHVGRVRIGDLNITILPKLNPTSLLRLLRYAFGFRRLKLISRLPHLVDNCGFEDLLISQLNAEVQELISRGLQRSYVRQNERLASPKGRINIDQLALDCGTMTATLPCRHHPRIEDTPLNRVLLGGLRLAGSLASHVDLRRDSRRLASLMHEQVSTIPLDRTMLDRIAAQLTRLTAAYSPAVSIIRLLVDTQGIVFESKTITATLPGFLFDMNSFFQALLSRFLRDNLPNHTIRDEFRLNGMMQYHPKFNPQRKLAPTPRPDYAVVQHGKVVSLLDAKYRDLWANGLPREMLYQLAIYALSQRQQPQSSILYPTLNDQAREARIDLNDPIFGGHLGQVCLRPVNLQRLEELVSSDSAWHQLQRVTEATRLAFGEPATTG